MPAIIYWEHIFKNIQGFFTFKMIEKKSGTPEFQ